MVQITDSNRPICAKCKELPALTLLNGLWLCGQCMANFCEKQERLKQEMILEE